MIALLECAVELHLADHAAQRRLRELRDRDPEIARPVRGEPGIGDLEIQNAVDLQLRIVLGDANLAGDIERDFAQVVLIRDAIDERQHEVEPRSQHRMEPPEALDDQRMLLRNDADRLDDDDDGHDE